MRESNKKKEATTETTVKSRVAAVESNKTSSSVGSPEFSPARGTVAAQSRHGGLKHSDSSFGLHIPDSFNDDVQMLIRKFKSDPHMKTNLSDSKVVLDPDLIDLTMIPPPMTPDEEGPARIFPGTASAVSTPPTPFADRQSLEAELQALERDLGGLNKTSWDEGAVYGAVRFGASSRGNTASWEAEEDEETSLNSLTMPDLVDSREPGGPSLAALRHLKSDDIDMFIANMAVPPPPSVVRQQQVQQKHSPVVELTSEELSAFIIPPPPATAAGGRQGGVQRGGGGDREVLELRVAAQQKQAPDNALSPKIASLQERLAQLSSSTEAQGRPGKEMSLTLTKDRYGYPVQGKGKGEVQSTREGPSSPKTSQAPPSRQETADRSNVLRGQVQTKRDIFLRQGSSPEIVKTRPEESPPPPPPRTAVPRHFSSSTLGRKSTPSTYQFGANMARSNSQEELSSNGTTNVNSRPPVRAMASKINGKLSSSSEDLGLKRSPISPSKLSVTSSSDSLSSTASVNTVKSASPQEEAPPSPPPPSLPPRLSPSKVAVKPPIPPLSPRTPQRPSRSS